MNLINSMMKKIFLIIFLVNTIFIKGQTNIYHPFPTSNSIWSQASSGNNGNSNSEFGLFGDTVINAYTFHKLYVRSITPCGVYNTMSPQNSSLMGAIMEDNMKRVYYRSFYSGCDSILKLYDFSKQAHNDTILFYQGFPSTCNAYAYAYLTIDSVDSVLVHNNYRKRIHFLEQGEIWIEGVGSLRGLLSSVSPYLTCSCIDRMVCNMQNDSLYYFNYNPIYGGYLNYCLCNYPLGIDEIKENADIKIYPNPTSTVLQLSIGDSRSTEYSIKITDVLGNEIAKQTIRANSQITINISAFPNGVYFIRVGNSTQRFVVQH